MEAKDKQQGSISFERYAGGRARIWHFSPTHDRLVVEFSEPSRRGVEYLVLTECVSIASPVVWTVKSPSLGRGPGRLMTFADDGVTIVGGSAVMQPTYRIE